MNIPSVRPVSRLPFFFGDALLICVAVFIALRSPTPLSVSTALLIAITVGLGAFLAICPYFLEHRSSIALEELEKFASVATEMNRVAPLTAALEEAAVQLRHTEEESKKTLSVAKSVADQMIQEGKAFAQIVAKANDSEKARLRMELEKFRRWEADSLAVLTGILDHVFALWRAAQAAGQPTVAQQMHSFQNACLEIARKIGLVSYRAEEGMLFDPARHQQMDGTAPDVACIIGETLAAGYTYRGQMVRRAVVKVQAPEDLKAAVIPADSAQPEAAVGPEAGPATTDASDQSLLL